ncbi:hypothetical protein BD414DRAFT_480450 [Trametes punicea]|nr:hypothetical protein BD414DRAFT_480450 [Trametes punicea]
MKAAVTSPPLGSHPVSNRPGEDVSVRSQNAVPIAVLAPRSAGGHGDQSTELRNIAPVHPSSESIPLPNPYEEDVPPPLPPRDEPVSPISPVSPRTSSYAHTSPTSHSRPNSYWGAPSAWAHEDSAVPLLSRETTQASRFTATSSLQEMAGYQKALEAHHRKEEEDAVMQQQRLGQGRAIPEDPPPLYRDRE